MILSETELNIMEKHTFLEILFYDNFGKFKTKKRLRRPSPKPLFKEITEP